MSYVVLNGKKSTLVKGLLIQSLPPISKPLLRTQVEEIDGRDGDIVTKLGYAAYDKQITVGLYGCYDIDDVIAYFDTDGTVIFSNEPDKYYYFQIIQQIDFSKLIRFKTATVTFHVQPFKFSAVEKMLVSDDADMVVSNTGNTFSRPKITVYGSGTITLSVNGMQAFVIELGNEGYITIDSAQMEAYKAGTLKNRLVSGNYDNLVLRVGTNTLSWVGDVTSVGIENYSRWI